jgi:hypothetical protein
MFRNSDGATRNRTNSTAKARWSVTEMKNDVDGRRLSLSSRSLILRSVFNAVPLL